MDNDDLMDEDMAFTPSAATEEATLRHQNTNNTTGTKAEYDLDMDDTEETKEEQSLGVVSVPVENVRQASKSLGINMLNDQQHQRLATMPDRLVEPQGGHSMMRR